MKKLALIILAFTCIQNSFSQDTIFFNDGRQIAVRLVELSRPIASYKVYGYSDGPLIRSDYFLIDQVRLESGERLIQENGILKSHDPNTNNTRRRSVSQIQNTYSEQLSDGIPDTVYVEVPVEKEADLSEEPDYMDKVLKLTGPRLGLTYFTNGKVDFGAYDAPKSPVMTQFGWQFETRYFTLKNGTQGLIEFVGLIGGMDQGLFLPSGNVLIGIRDAKGFELGFGPSLSVGGASFVIAAGMSFRTENVYIPVNLAVTASPKNPRVSLLVGFNGRKK